MNREVSPVVLEKTDRCPRGMKCLKKGEKPVCEVERLIDGAGAFLKSDGVDICPYKMSFGSAYVCNCPIRYELHKKYGV
ncbi:MAG: hypothetical protein JW743_04175 [Deltaproteobacteria bacterium]|nr:hypothetical protein [Deltaproteobacteria bacterium]MBN2844789.1 hypothetical protein [Deltaproteobacteria bacterium]